MLFCIYSSFCSVIIHKVFYRVYLVSPQLDHKLMGSWTVLIFFLMTWEEKKTCLAVLLPKEQPKSMGVYFLLPQLRSKSGTRFLLNQRPGIGI